MPLLLVGLGGLSVPPLVVADDIADVPEDASSGLAIKPLPHWLFRFVLDPYEVEGDRLQRVAEDLEEWLAKDDTYVLEAWGNTFFIDRRDGHCTAS